ncbi:hypothetical protein ONE63_008157 [Megalurothrips usitatus]|uniref:Uncharacterized protein n=1 Tax=Megalurothrips usitatus TaxID=439358 RepID=A0AAV7XKA8_9NEOP|nr:hypothetical protein ONE63_008157 [Megalurothrips usitatus]
MCRDLARFLGLRCAYFLSAKSFVSSSVTSTSACYVDCCRAEAASGFTYKTRADWNARPPTAKAATLATPVQYIVIQHTVEEPCFSPKACAKRTRFIQDLHMDVNGWLDIGYNFLVGGDGTALEGRGWSSVGAFLKGWNKKSIGVVLIGTFVEVQPTEAQMTALRELIEQGVTLGKVRADYKVVAACELAETRSPGTAALAALKKWDHWWDTGVDHCN